MIDLWHVLQKVVQRDVWIKWQMKRSLTVLLSFLLVFLIHNDVNELIKYLLLIYGLFSNQKRVKMTFDFMSFSIGVNSIIELQLGSRTRYYLCMWHCDRHINKSGIILISVHITSLWKVHIAGYIIFLPKFYGKV